MRIPPELKLTPVGFQAAVIPLAMSREMSFQAPPQLTPSSLFENQAKLDAIRLQVYNRILGNTHQKIRVHSTLPNSTQMISVEVSEWQPGCPSFDVKDCILYIVWNLRHSGFKVMYVSPNRLLISWKDQSIQYYQEESPIRQAMIAAANAPANQQVKPEKAGEKKKAANYKPANEGVAAMLASGKRNSAAAAATITFI